MGRARIDQGSRQLRFSDIPQSTSKLYRSSVSSKAIRRIIAIYPCNVSCWRTILRIPITTVFYASLSPFVLLPSVFEAGIVQSVTASTMLTASSTAPASTKCAAEWLCNHRAIFIGLFDKTGADEVTQLSAIVAWNYSVSRIIRRIKARLKSSTAI